MTNNVQNISTISKRQFKLYIGEPTELQKNEKAYKMNLVDQEKTKAGHYQPNFILKKEANVNKDDIMVKMAINCIQNDNKLNVPEEEIRRIMNEFKKLNQVEESEESSEEENSDNKSENVRGRGRPKGSKNKKK